MSGARRLFVSYDYHVVPNVEIVMILGTARSGPLPNPPARQHITLSIDRPSSAGCASMVTQLQCQRRSYHLECLCPRRVILL